MDTDRSDSCPQSSIETLDRLVSGDRVYRNDIEYIAKEKGVEVLEWIDDVFEGAESLSYEEYLDRIPEDRDGGVLVVRENMDLMLIPLGKIVYENNGDTLCTDLENVGESYRRDFMCDLKDTSIADAVLNCTKAGNSRKVKIISLIQRSGAGKTHSSFQLSQLDKFKNVSTILLRFAKYDNVIGETSLMKFLKNNEDDEKIEEFAKKCVRIAMSRRFKDPSKIQDMAIKGDNESIVQHVENVFCRSIE